MNDPGPRPSWHTPREAVRVVLHPAHLRRTVLTALIVGTVLFAINQLDAVLAGNANAATWVKTGLFYLVFCVANVDLLLGSRRDHQ